MWFLFLRLGGGGGKHAHAPSVSLSAGVKPYCAKGEHARIHSSAVNLVRKVVAQPENIVRASAMENWMW